MIQLSRFWLDLHGRSLIFDMAGVARPVLTSSAWPFIALVVGLLPLTLGYAGGLAFHQPLTGLLLAPLFWACVYQDRLGRALLLVTLVMGSHSALAIFLSAHDPVGAAAVLTGGQAYWEQTRNWIQTGDDPEYRLAVWLPQHLLLFGVVLLGGGLTLGVVPFAVGVEQVDLMNFYVGRMISQSDNPVITLLFGWHPWSLLRGLAYTVLVFASASWALERVTSRVISTDWRHLRRFALAATLAVADALTKLWLAPIVREQLFATVWPGAR